MQEGKRQPSGNEVECLGERHYSLMNSNRVSSLLEKCIDYTLNFR